MEIIKTRTGKIYVDRGQRLEFLTVGDYGKENNIKADFLGYKKRIDGVAHKEVDLSEKWVATISTQKGCQMKCNFCDVHKFGFYGNVSLLELRSQIYQIIKGETCRKTNRFNLHYARMGEPSFNMDVLKFTKRDLDKFVKNCGLDAKEIHPVVSTMMPKDNKGLELFLSEWCKIKNEKRKGNAGLQLSINSTDDVQRAKQFNYKSLSLAEISKIAAKLPMPVGRKYTLNFAVTSKSIIDVDVLNRLFSKEKFIIKITPIHETETALKNGYDVETSYDSFDVYEQYEQKLVAAGWEVIVFVPSKEEDSDRITCGNALITMEAHKYE